jgi:diguanylate cyclase (GGDEF)-like protein
MPVLEFQTIAFSFFISNIIITIVMAYVWFLNRKRFAGTSRWFIFHILFTIGMFFLMIRKSVPYFVSSVLTHSFIICGLMFFYIGLQRFIGKKASYVKATVFFLIFFFLSYFFAYVFPSIKLRIILYSLYFVIINLQAIYLLLFETQKNQRVIYRNTAIVCGLMTMLYSFRIIAVFLYIPGMESFLQGPLDSLLIMASQMLNIAMTFSLVLMINSRLFLEVQDYANEKEMMAHELRKLANTDSLTAVFNRAKIEQTLTIEVLRSRRYKHPLSIIIADIDHFKQVNDTYGHNAGDLVLTGIASILKHHVREVDTVGRWGGEEFLIVCPETTAEGAKKLAEKLRKKIEKHHFKDIGIKTISMGVAQIEIDDWDEDMIKRADKNLYKAKKAGRNRVE